MIANSHQADNVFDSCLDELIQAIADVAAREDTRRTGKTCIVLRPHPQYVRRFPARWQAIKEKLKSEVEVEGKSRSGQSSTSTRNFDLIFEDDFSKPSTMDQSDVLVTDWSGIAYEFAYKTRRPTLFVNTPMKVINPEWKKIDLVPTDISFRDEVGVSIECGALGDRALPDGSASCLDVKAATAALSDMLAHPDAFAAKIDAMFAKNFFNPGRAGEAAGSYILDFLIEKKKK